MNNIQTIQLRDSILRLFPGIDRDILNKIVERERLRPTNKGLHAESFIPLAIASVAGYIRHRMTPYDMLLGTGRYTRERAKDKVRPVVNRYELDWGRL